MPQNPCQSISRVRRSVSAWFTAVLVLVLLVSCQQPRLSDAPVALDAATLPPPVRVPYEVMTSPGTSLAGRAGAAEQLLGLVDREPKALEALSAGLAPALPGLSALQTAQVNQGVAQAVAARSSAPPADLWRPMLARLGDIDSTVFDDLAKATGRFNDPVMLERLTAMANDPNVTQPARNRAILCLGHQRTQQTVDVVLPLSGNQHPAEVRSAAFDALAILTGITTFGEDRGQWDAWWSEARRLNSAEWERRLRENFVRRDSAEVFDSKKLVDRLRESMTAQYRISSSEDRPRVLTYLLGDELQTMRDLGMSLAEQRLSAGEPFDDGLRGALRKTLDDELPEMRRRAAIVLRDLADEAAADIVADKLSADAERVTSTLRAYLRLLTRAPRSQAIEAAYGLLLDPALRSEAAGVLAASGERGMFDEAQKSRVLRRVRQFVEEVPSDPPPQVVTLLGRVGGESDYERIARWVDHPDPSVKQAAAKAWADSQRTLIILAERADDPIIQPIVITAAQQRGRNPQTMAALAQHPPDSGQAREAWDRALVAMAGRVAEERVLEVERGLANKPGTDALRESMMTAALEARPGVPLSVSGRWLLLDRAELRLASGRARVASIDFEMLLEEPLVLSDEQRERAYRGLIRAALETDQLAKAFGVARSLLEGPDGNLVQPATDDPIIGLFLDTAQAQANAGRRAQARKLLDELRLLLGPRMKPEVAQQLRVIEQTITQ